MKQTELTVMATFGVFETLIATLSIFIVAFAMDTLVVMPLTSGKLKARWFLLHALLNLFVVIFSIPDVLQVLLDPIHAIWGVYSMIPVHCIAALHLYHFVAFSNLTWDDVMHHVVFAGVICTFALLLRYGPVQNVMAFFLSGLPGGLDDAMLAAVKMDHMDPQTQKLWAARINTWIRAPGTLFTSFVIYVGLVCGHSPNLLHGITIGIAGVLCAFNGMYYQHRVVVSAARGHESYTS